MKSQTGNLILVSVAALALGFTACRKDKDDDDDLPVIPAPTDGGDEGDGGDVVPEPLTIGEVASAEGDVVKDEDGLFSLTRAFTFTLTEETELQVRKSYANGNCGTPTGSFALLKGEEQVADTAFDPSKDYAGVPVEKFTGTFAPGDYVVMAFITLEQECKDMLFYYEFILEKPTA